MDARRRLTALQFQRSPGVEDWRVLAFDAGAWFAAPSHAAGAELVRRVLAIGDAVGHVPDVDLRAAGAPDWWTLADPEGNEVDVGVAVGREERAAVRQQP